MNQIFNKEKANRHTMNDRELLSELIGFSLGEIPGMLRSLEEALGDPDGAAGTAELAHKIKGAAGAVSAECLYQASFELELAAKEGRAKELPGLADGVRAAFDDFKDHPEVAALV